MAIPVYLIAQIIYYVMRDDSLNSCILFRLCLLVAVSKSWQPRGGRRGGRGGKRGERGGEGGRGGGESARTQVCL